MLITVLLAGCSVNPPGVDGDGLDFDEGCDDAVGEPEQLFEQVWEHLDATYPYFDYKQVDWAERRELCHEHVCGESAVYDDFAVTAMECLVGPLSDYHVTLADRDGDVASYGLSGFNPNYDWVLTRGYLDEPSMVETEVTLTATLLDGRFGYLRIDTFDPAVLAAEGVDVAALVDALGPVEGVVIDVRANGGGDEALAAALAGRFVADTTTPYAFASYREETDGDPLTHELGAPAARTLPASSTAPYVGPVAVLQGGGCISSCELFVEMTRLAPEVRTFGSTTYGASGDPRPLDLLDGESQLQSSTWYLTRADGETPIEWNGLAVDEPASFIGEYGDEVLDAALVWLAN